MLNFFRKKSRDEETVNTDWEMGENPPLPFKGDREFNDLVEDVFEKLDQIKVLVEEMKNERNS